MDFASWSRQEQIQRGRRRGMRLRRGSAPLWANDGNTRSSGPTSPSWTIRRIGPSTAPPNIAAGAPRTSPHGWGMAEVEYSRPRISGTPLGGRCPLSLHEVRSHPSRLPGHPTCERGPSPWPGDHWTRRPSSPRGCLGFTHQGLGGGEFAARILVGSRAAPFDLDLGFGRFAIETIRQCNAPSHDVEAFLLHMRERSHAAPVRGRTVNRWRNRRFPRCATEEIPASAFAPDHSAPSTRPCRSPTGRSARARACALSGACGPPPFSLSACGSRRALPA